MSSTLPRVASKYPMRVQVEEGKTYYWCACGMSEAQPFCDGSHVSTDFLPVSYTADATEAIGFCCCKRSNKGPICDGTHKKIL